MIYYSIWPNQFTTTLFYEGFYLAEIRSLSMALFGVIKEGPWLKGGMSFLLRVQHKKSYNSVISLNDLHDMKHEKKKKELTSPLPNPIPSSKLQLPQTLNWLITPNLFTPHLDF